MSILQYLKQTKQNFGNWLIYGSRRNNKSFIKYLRNKGVQVGESVVFYEPYSNLVDIQNPYLLKIGDNVRITHGVIILTHDYSWSVLAGKYGICTGAVSPVTIGNNVFIGMNAIICRGVTIGSHVIIGAGSVVTRDCEDNSVYAGNPAKKICSLEDFYNKRKANSLNEAREIAKRVKEKGKEEQFRALREYSCLFMDKTDPQIKQLFIDTGYPDVCMAYYNDHPPKFNGLDEWISANLN